MEVQNKHANGINVLIYQEKKIIWVAGLRKGRAKEFGRTSARVRGRKKKGSPPFPSRARKSLYLSEAYRAGQEKDSKRLGTLSARLIAKKLCDMSSSNTQGWRDEGGTMNRRKYKGFYFITYSVLFLLSCMLPFLTVTLPRNISYISNCEMKWTQGKSDEAWEDLANEARAILVIVIHCSYKCVEVNLVKKRRILTKKEIFLFLWVLA